MHQLFVAALIPITYILVLGPLFTFGYFLGNDNK